MAYLANDCRRSDTPVSQRSIERLDCHLGRILAAVVTIVSAPPGAGKTTALQRWSDLIEAGGEATAWLSVDERSVTAPGLFAALCETIGRACQGWQPPRDEADMSPAAAAARLGAAWSACDQRLTVLIDGLDQADPPAIALLRRLIDILPARARIIVASRSRVPLGISRLRLFGWVVEIGPAELRFSDDEIDRLLDSQVSDEQRAALLEATDGWAAGLGLAARSLSRGMPPAQVLSLVRGRSATMADFFTETVLDHVDARLADFLVATSFLAALDPVTCDAATGRSDSRSMLAAAHRLNLFIEPLDAEHATFRLMRPFREFLQRRLEETEPAGERRMSRAIADHLLALGRVNEALGYAARAGDQAYLADLLEQHCEAMTYRGDILRVVDLAAGLPRACVDALPRLLLILAWARTRHLETEAARQLITRARRPIDALDTVGGQDEEVAWLRLVLLHRETMLAAAEDKYGLVETNCEILIPRFSEHPYLLCSLHAQLNVARRERYRIADLPALEARTRTALTAASCDFAAITVEISVGPGLMAAGKLDEAIAGLERGYDHAVRLAGEGSSLAALAALPLAEALYERNDLKRAGRLVADHIDARLFSFADQLISGFLTQSRLCQARGDMDAALHAADEGIRVGLERNLERLRITMVGEKIRLMLRMGQASHAVEIAAASGIQGPAAAFAPGACPTTCDELRALAWCRLNIGQDRVQDVASVVKQWRRFFASRGAKRSLVRWGLQLAICLTMEGEQNSAQRAFREAAAIAADGGWIRVFLDEGQIIRTLVSECVGHSNLGSSVVDQFQNALVAAFGIRTDQAPNGVASADLALYGRLLPRELEILSLVGTGMRNREIGMRLGLTEGTVKWYMTQIYDKVGVRRRPQAVDRARMFGLLA